MKSLTNKWKRNCRRIPNKHRVPYNLYCQAIHCTPLLHCTLSLDFSTTILHCTSQNLYYTAEPLLPHFSTALQRWALLYYYSPITPLLWWSALQRTSPVLHAIVLYYMVQCYALHCISLHGAVLYSALYFTTLRKQCTPLHFAAQCSAVHCTSLAPHSTAPHSMVQCTSL